MKIKTLNINKLQRIKPGEVRITPLDNRFYANVPYLNSKSNLPQWFKRVPRGQMSVRSCSGISDFLEFGMTITAWSNFTFIPRIDNQSWDVRVDQLNPHADRDVSQAGGFRFEQTGQCPMTEIRKLEKMTYPKLVSPWRIQTAPGWSCIVLPIMYEENHDYSVLPALVNTDFYQIVNIVLNVKTNAEFSIRQGTPIAHIIPVERKNNFKTIETVDETFFKYASSNMYLTGGVAPAESTGIAYRKATKVVDAALENKSKWKNPWLKK